MKLRFTLQSLTRWVLFLSIVVFTTTTNTQINRLTSLLVIGICGMNILSEKNHRLRFNTMSLGYLFYTLILCLSVMYAIAPQNKVQSMIISCLLTLALTILFHNNIRSKEDVTFYLKAFMVAGIAVFFSMLSTYGFSVISKIAQSELSIRIGDDTSNSNSVGMALAYGAIIAVYFFLDSRNKKAQKIQSLSYLVIILLTSSLSLLSGSRKALLILGFGFAVLFVFCGNNRNVIQRLKSVIIAIVAVFILYYLLSNIPAFRIIKARMDSLIGGFLGTQDYDHSSVTRFYLIDQGWEAFLQHPILGEGVYASYNYFGAYAHNNFIEVLMNTGLIGFLVFYTPYIIVLYKFAKTSRNDKQYWIHFVLFIWIFIGGYGMVTYYSKISTFMVVLANEWVEINNRERIQECHVDKH